MSFNRILAACLFVAVSGTHQVCDADGLARFESPKCWQEDAELTDVYFLNEQLGWAVGAQGVILRTVDGGKNWMPSSTVGTPTQGSANLGQKLRRMQSIHDVDQLQPVRCRLETVHFVDAQHGWIAGGYEYPYIGRSRAIVLKTKDGGETWREINGLVLPRIRKLHFQDKFTGWAVGDSSDLYKTGIFLTTDGGNTWSSQSQGRLQDWMTGESTSGGFVVLDQLGRLAKMTQQKVEPAVILANDARQIRELSLLDDLRGLAVGDRGTILKTENGGLSWSRPPQFDSPLLKQMDFRAVTNTADKFWIAGYPGSRIVSIDKRTGEMQSHATPVSMPLNKIVFANEQQGWAVGALGSIVATHDGGQTWQRQRGQNRVALLNIITSAAEAPLEILARYASEEELLAANVVLRGSADSYADTELLQQASERLGASCSFGIPATVEQDLENIEALVKVIRSLRPNVLVTNSNYQAKSLIDLAIREAARRESFPEQIQDLGLEPWQIDRFAAENEQGQLTLDGRRLLPRSGQLIEDEISVSRALLGLDVQSNRQHSYRVVNISSASRLKNGELFLGLTGFGKEIPDRQDKGRRGNLAVIQHTSQKQKIMEQLAVLPIDTPQQALDWRKQIQAWIGLVQPETASVWVLQLAQLYLDQGQPELAAEAIELVANRWPDYAFGPAAMKWLIQYYSSAECTNFAFHQTAGLRARAKTEQSSAAIGTTAVIRDEGVVQSIWIPIPQEKLMQEEQESVAEVDDEQPVDEFTQFSEARRQRASLHLSRLRQRDPDLALGAEYRFIEAQLTAQQYGWLPAANLLKLLTKRAAEDPEFATAARREIQIQGENQELRKTIPVIRTTERPFLDGKMDDQVWRDLQSADKLIFRSALGTKTPGPDRFGFAYDDEFLYAIVINQKVAGQSYSPSDAKSTTRDPDLGRRDRIEINLDSDRDYCSAMQFTVDCRGWAAENCFGGVGWDPDWFVARGQNAESWIVEIAIPLEQLAGSLPTSGEVWAIDIRRLSYDSSDLWKSENSSGSPRIQSPKTGLRTGLCSHPEQFQLLEFE